MKKKYRVSWVEILGSFFHTVVQVVPRALRISKQTVAKKLRRGKKMGLAPSKDHTCFSYQTKKQKGRFLFNFEVRETTVQPTSVLTKASV